MSETLEFTNQVQAQAAQELFEAVEERVRLLTKLRDSAVNDLEALKKARSTWGFSAQDLVGVATAAERMDRAVQACLRVGLRRQVDTMVVAAAQGDQNVLWAAFAQLHDQNKEDQS